MPDLPATFRQRGTTAVTFKTHYGVNGACPGCGAPTIALHASEPRPFAVNPAEAIGFMRDKVRVPTRSWTDLWQGMHARAFVVAGAQSDQLLEDFHQAVTDSIAQGRTLAQFRADFDRIVAAHGWSYHGTRNWRSRVIFETNMRMSYAAGRWAQIQRVKHRRPFLRYVAVMDERTRPLHREWHGTILEVDDPWWQTHYPPNDWGCRCTVMSLSERDLKRYGWNVSPSAPPSPLVDRVINTPNGPVALKVPEGTGPGFAYNVGEAGFGRGSQLMAMARHSFTALEAPGASRGVLPPLPLDSVPEVERAAALTSEPALRAALRAAIGGDEAIVADPTGTRVRLTQAIVDHMLQDASRLDGRERYFPLMPELVRRPAEIWIGFARDDVTGRVALRRRYVKLVDIGGGHAIGLIADAQGGEWAGLTFFRGRAGRAPALTLRSGHLIWRREE